MAITTIVATTLQGLGGTHPPPPPPPAQHGTKYHYESLRKNNAPTFDGSSDPEVGRNWLKNMETQLWLLEISEGVKVDVVTPFLEDKARKWWEAISPAMMAYFLAKIKLQKLNEFENFVQTPEMSVMEYTSKFNSLGTYVPTTMADDTQKMHRYKKGLNSRIQSALAVYQATTFVDLMGAAIRAETDIQRREDEHKNKRPFSVSTNQSGQKFKKPNQSSGPSKSSIPTDAAIKLCPICNFRHPGECRRTSGACFNYGKMGHRIADCPEPKKVGMRSNVGATPGKPKENKPNAWGLPSLKRKMMTQTMSWQRFSKKLRLEPEMLVKPYRVTTPTRKTIETHKVHRNCNICINKHAFEASLIQLNMVEFDAILGMDWLAKNHALVDCREKNVKLWVPNKKKFVFQGKDKGHKSLLSASQAWNSMKNGEKIYLAMISEVKEIAELKLEDISVVQEFPDVFPEELPGTVPDREVEFEINLVPDAVPISKAPYRMAPAELKELKDQLQELLDKKQIRPSASPWGAPVLFVKKKTGV
ncbi:uncharacterized protein [Henckelia pumila]|uniref:uncharacterized protein n=1 Tax=Henckelia pumila TaxID=405737 RepID=UPI003C6DDA2B